MSRAGVVLGRFDVSVGTPTELPGYPLVAYGGGMFLVTWQTTWLRSGEVGTEIRAARVMADGAVADPVGFLVTDQTVFGIDVAFGRTEFLVVWSEYGSTATLGIHGTRVTTAGAVPTPDGFSIATTGAHEVSPALAWNGDHHLVVWTSMGDVDRFDTWDIHGTRVDGSGERLDPFNIPISTGTGQKREPHVAANGPFLVTWMDGRRGQFENSVFAARVDADGTVAHPDGFELLPPAVGNAMSAADLSPSADDGDFSFTYARDVPEQPYAASRVFTRKVSPK